MNNHDQTIIPHLWFDTQAIAAANFYAGVFPDSKVTGTCTLRDTPGGDCELVSFTVWGEKFEAISGGPQFTINPSISFIVNFDPLMFGVCDSAKTAARETLDTVWVKLIDGGKIMIPLGTYPFSEYYGWVQDKYGVSWQLILTRPEGDPRPGIVPAMMFTGPNAGKAEAAVDFYLTAFANARRGGLRRYSPGMAPNKEGTIMFSDFAVGKSWIAAMDSADDNPFNFNEAVSYIVYCQDQAEVDHYWNTLNANPEGGQCGWLKDQFGVSWQIVPAVMHDMLYNGSEEQVDRLMKVALTQKKFDVATLEKAFHGN